MAEFTPVLPPHWTHVIGVVPIPEDDLRTWDEDIFSAEWCPGADGHQLSPGKGWWIWLDGGKGLSIWQCSLVEPTEPDGLTEDGTPKHDHHYLMRDFVDTSEQVQSWIDRAVVIAQKYEDEQDSK